MLRVYSTRVGPSVHAAGHARYVPRLQLVCGNDEASPGRIWDHKKLLERGFLLCTASIYHYDNIIPGADMCCARILRARALLGTLRAMPAMFRGYSWQRQGVSGTHLGPQKAFPARSFAPVSLSISYTLDSHPGGASGTLIEAHTTAYNELDTSIFYCAQTAAGTH